VVFNELAAVIGIGIDMQPKGNMIVDIGGGTTEIGGNCTLVELFATNQ
jgi:actin-like ATPase involved in cell morphogenesis